jgi:hypothetical protein
MQEELSTRGQRQQITGAPAAASETPISPLNLHTSKQGELLTLVEDIPQWSHEGTICRRVILVSEDVGVVVFVSDSQSKSPSITNAFERLSAASKRDVYLPTAVGAQVLPSKIRWYECRTGEVTASGVQQSLCFDEVSPGTGGRLEWRPARDPFSIEVALLLDIPQVRELVLGMRSE